jgi:hypothetical protein
MLKNGVVSRASKVLNIKLNHGIKKHKNEPLRYLNIIIEKQLF